MKLKNINEFELISKLTAGLAKDSSVAKSVGDDAAVIEYNKEEYLLFATDILVEDVHFKIESSNIKSIGYKSLAVNISDIAAMAGIPKYAVCSLALPKSLSIDYTQALYQGIKKAADLYNVSIVGGDISTSNKLIINNAVLGLVKKKNLTLRETAKVKDAIFVTGSLGGSFKGKHLSFKPRIKEAQILTDKFDITSMIDLSDGLASDLYQIITQSKVGAVIYQDKIPLSKEAEDIKSALYDGEDFELLFTANKKDAQKIKKLMSHQIKISEIGEIINSSKGYNLITTEGKRKSISLDQSFHHFKKI
jgi:thiamine-monophosphate kinase